MNMGADGEILNDAPGVPFLTCGFFTDGYAAEAAQLRESLDRTGTPYFLKRFASRGYWEANTRIKPEFLLDCLRRFPGRDVVYLDADSVVRSPLKLFFDFDADLGVFIAPADAGMTHRYLTGTLYLRNTPAVRAFVDGLRYFTLAESLGGVESLVAHPATMTHAAMTPEARAKAGISDGLLRLSVGIEAAEDLLADIAAGLERAAAAIEAKAA